MLYSIFGLFSKKDSWRTCTQILFHPVSRHFVGIGIGSSSYPLHPEDGVWMFFQNISIHIQDHNLNCHCPENLRTYDTVTELTQTKSVHK
jgi:hypothetical protein